MRKNIVFLGLLFIANVSLAQLEDVKRITQTLCSPEMEGRGYVNNGDGKAAIFIADEFKKVGIQPIESSYFQSFGFSVNTFPAQASFSYPTKELKVGVDVLVDPASPGFTGILKPKLLLPAQLLNGNVLMTELQEVIAGSIYNSVAIDLTTENKDTLNLLAKFKYELAQFVPVIEITNAKFTWSVDREQLKFLVLQIKPESFNLGEALEVNLQAKLIENHSTNNVVGIIKGKNKSKKMLVFTAHYDHLGRLGQSTYFPGANDNASGVAMIIEMAKYFKTHPQKFDVAFIAFAGEEAGLLGSKYFVENPMFDLKKIEFLINLDIMGSGEDGVTVVNGSVFKEQFNTLTTINTELNLLTQIKERGYAANSDHYWFTDAGVPSFFIYTMGPNKNYHDIFDVYESLSFAESQDIVTLLVKFVEQLYNK